MGQFYLIRHRVKITPPSPHPRGLAGKNWLVISPIEPTLCFYIPQTFIIRSLIFSSKEILIGENLKDNSKWQNYDRRLGSDLTSAIAFELSILILKSFVSSTKNDGA